MKISVASGGFDPLHKGHIKYLKATANLGDYTIVLLNSDDWLTNKKGKPFMQYEERKIILENLSFVDKVMSFVDDENGSCINGLMKIHSLYPNDEIIFCNGGDRSLSNSPENSLSFIEHQYGVGGSDKINSSSKLVSDFATSSTETRWGYYRVLFNHADFKIKELVVYPKRALSLQRHFERREHWFVLEGSLTVKYIPDPDNDPKLLTLNEYDNFNVNKKDWHQIYNHTDKDCKIIEIQYDGKFIENDIERMSYSFSGL